MSHVVLSFCYRSPFRETSIEPRQHSPGGCVGSCTECGRRGSSTGASHGRWVEVVGQEVCTHSISNTRMPSQALQYWHKQTCNSELLLDSPVKITASYRGVYGHSIRIEDV